jgi:hypothetical protein
LNDSGREPDGLLKLPKLRNFTLNHKENSASDPVVFGFGRSALVLIVLMCAVATAVSIWFLTISHEKPSKTQVRICNGTGNDIQALIVGGRTIGYLPKNTMTDYRPSSRAYRYASVSAEIEGRRFDLKVDDFIGEVPLGEGFFTYTISRTGVGIESRIEANVCDMTQCSCSEHAKEVMEVHI